MAATAEDLSTVEASEKLYRLCADLIQRHSDHVRRNSLTQRLVLVEGGEALEVSEFIPIGGHAPTCYQVRLSAENSRYQVAEEAEGFETTGLINGTQYERAVEAITTQQLCERLEAAQPL